MKTLLDLSVPFKSEDDGIRDEKTLIRTDNGNGEGSSEDLDSPISTPLRKVRFNGLIRIYKYRTRRTSVDLSLGNMLGF